MSNWPYKLDLSAVFHDDTKTFKKRRNAIVAVIKASKYYREVVKIDFNLDAWTRDLASSEDAGEFDEAWDEFYNTADDHGCWVVTR